MENSILQKVKDTEKLFEGYEIIGNELARVTALREKLEQQHMTVSVIGQFKRGKSALVNGILGRDILPVPWNKNSFCFKFELYPLYYTQKP